MISRRILVFTLTFCAALKGAQAGDTAAYFIVDGNPAAVKYVSGRLVRLPVQDTDKAAGLQELETVAGLRNASRLTRLENSHSPSEAQFSEPRIPEYGVPMFEYAKHRQGDVVWSGPTPFREIALRPAGIDQKLQLRLAADSRRWLLPKLPRQVELMGPVSIRNYGRITDAPDLAFIDITWRIKRLPASLANNGIDSMSPFWRVEYVVDARSVRMIFRNATNVGGISDRDMRLFKEPGGPLLMSTTITCLDGGDPLILDLMNETYGTGRHQDVAGVSHCFPAH